MEPAQVFSTKAEKYARYRWDYSPLAVQALFDAVGLSLDSTVADIGAGTGILTKHFVGRVKLVYAIEPNDEMRQIAVKTLAGFPSCKVINGRAEATTLEDDSVDMITVATAFNWFDPEPTRVEFRRILKPGGWLAKLSNYGTNRELGEASGKVYPAQTDTESIMKGLNIPFGYYLGSDDFQKITSPFTNFNNWDTFFGAMSTASYAPDEGSPYYADFERAARQVFDRFAENDMVRMDGVTELIFGRLI